MITETITLTDAQIAFRDFCRSVNLDPGHNPEPTHGKVRRFDVIDVDGRKKKNRGWYAFYADSRPAGVVCDHAIGVKHTWKYQGEIKQFSKEEWEQERKRMRAENKRRHDEQLEAYAAATRKARAKIELSSPAKPDHAYLVKKRIGPHNARSIGKALLIPIYGPDAEIQSLQEIGTDGFKKMFPGAPSKMGYTVLGKEPQAASIIVICEGWATGATIAEAVHESSVLVAFSATNLPLIADMAAKKYRHARLIIAADDDNATEKKTGTNPGMKAATQAARATCADLAVPVFSETDGTDFNDMTDTAQIRDIILKSRPIGAKIETSPPPPAEYDEPHYLDIDPDDIDYDPDYAPAVLLDPVTDIVEALKKAPVTDWRDLLAYGDKGEIQPRDFGNMRLLLIHHEEMAAVFRKDLFASQITVTNAPWDNVRTPRHFTDDDIAHCREWLQRHGSKPSQGETLEAIRLAANHNAFDPVKDYLLSTKWDGKPRLDQMLTYYFGADPTGFTPVASAKFMISAVARALAPGCKVDTMLILEGPQGAKKSSGIAALFGEDVTRSSTNLFDSAKVAVEIMTGAWCIEVAEMAALLKQQNANEKIKAIITTQVDTVRLSYARVTSQFPRRSILVATINPGDNGYLSDMTGNRRYWPVVVKNIDIDAIRADRDQLWAEAVARYKAHEAWWLESSEMVLCAEQEAAERVEMHPWDDWLQNDYDFINREFVTISDAFASLGIPARDRNMHAQKTISGSLRRLGFDKINKKLNGRVVKVWSRI
jgi:putative DNA primase/helicase